MAKGVETNEFSRFVDHTLATPWETLISDIEKSLRLLNKLYNACETSTLIELNVYERELLQLPTHQPIIATATTASAGGVSPTPSSVSGVGGGGTPSLLSPIITNTNNNHSSLLYDANFIKKKIFLKYLDYDFILEEFSLQSVNLTSSQLTWIYKLLHFPTFFLFYFVPSYTSTGQEIQANHMKMTILSAFTIAVKSVNDLKVPTFFTMERFDLWNFNSMKDCIGYRPMKLVLNQGNGGQGNNNTDSSNTSANTQSEDVYWIRYESVIVNLGSNSSNSVTSSIKSAGGGGGSNRSSMIVPGTVNTTASTNTGTTTKRQHPLYYFDGIRKLYQKKVNLLNLDYNLLIYEHFQSKIIHDYHYDKKLWMTSAIALQNYSNNRIYYGNKSYYILNNPYDYTSSTNIEMNMLANYTTKHFIDILTTLLNCGSYSYYLYDYLTISLSYYEGNQYSIIDNEAYSTLLPSKQTYNNWKLLPFFKKANYQLLPMNIYNILYFQWKSIVIRRLLSMYILSIFVKFDGFDFHHFYQMANNPPNSTNNTNNSGNSASGGSGKTSNASRNNLFPEHFLLNTERYLELQDLLNHCSKETKYIFGSIFPAEMIYSEKYYQYHHRSHRNSRTNNTNNDNNNNTNNNNNDDSNESKKGDAHGNGNGNSTYSISQEQQYQQLFQQVFQYLFTSKNDNSTASTTSDKLDENGTEDISGKRLNYIENWIQAFGILSGLLPLKGPYILRLWQYCLRELQHIYDNDQLLSWAQKSFGINLNVDYQDDTTYTTNNPDGGAEGLYDKPLWNDVLYKKHHDLGLQILLPDVNKPILIQKLMMIFFCIFMKKEKNTYEIKTITATATNVTDEQGNNSNPSSSSPTVMGYHSSGGGGYSGYGPNPLLSLKSVTLFRRIPLTSDIIAMQQHMLKKFQFERSKIDSIVNEHPLIKYQITVPTLLSDMALFKYNNPTVPFPVFYKWYGLQYHPLLGIEDIDEWSDYLQAECFNGDEEYQPGNGDEDFERELMGRPSQANLLISLETIESEKDIVTLKLLQGLAEMYYTIDPRSIAEQKPVFSSEKEIGKSIAYLERMSINNFLLEIIYYSLHFICSFIDQSNNYFNSKKIFLIFIQNKLILLKNQLMKLNNIIELKRKIIPNISSSSSSNQSPTSTRNNSGANTPMNHSPSQSKRKQATTNEGGPSTQSNHSNNPSEVSNMEIILLIDSICVIVEELELFYCKLHQLLPMIEVFMNSPFRQSTSPPPNEEKRGTTKEGEEEDNIHSLQSGSLDDDNLEINDNILQLILHWIENHEEYSCQSMNEVNYIKMMMKTCYNLQQQQLQQPSSASSPAPPTGPSLSTASSLPTSSIDSPTVSGKHQNQHRHRSTTNSNDLANVGNVKEPVRGDSRELSGEKTNVVKSIDSAPSAAMANQDHDWYSYDGRELPSLPSCKEFHVFSASKFPVPSLLSNDKSTLVEPVKLDFVAEEIQEENTSAEIIDKKKNKKVRSASDKKEVNEFSLIISTDGNSMRMIHEILEIN